LEDLKQNLAESGNLMTNFVRRWRGNLLYWRGSPAFQYDNYETTIKEQENLLKDLQTQLNAMSETFKTQSALSAKYERNSKFWRTFTIVAIPVTAVISGAFGFALAK